jgi:hypothetical protein
VVWTSTIPAQPARGDPEEYHGDRPPGQTDKGDLFHFSGGSGGGTGGPWSLASGAERAGMVTPDSLWGAVEVDCRPGPWLGGEDRPE